jgi:xanthine dehydrogenase molybdopterin-binding subunit B
MRIGHLIRAWHDGGCDDPAPQQAERSFVDQTGWLTDEERARYNELGDLSRAKIFKLCIEFDMDRLAELPLARAEMRARTLAESKALTFLEGELL